MAIFVFFIIIDKHLQGNSMLANALRERVLEREKDREKEIDKY